MRIQYQDAKLVVLESALFRTTTTLIIADHYLLLVDPNWFPIELDFIASFIQKLDHGGDRYLLFTHSDYDHIIGYQTFIDYTTLASQNFVNNPDKQKVLDQIIALDDDNYVKRDYEITYPEINMVIKSDNEQKSIGSDEYTFYQARGHNKDGLITLNKSKGILIVGDYLSNIEFPYLYDSFKLYKETLQTLTAIINENEIKTLVSGHGDITHLKSEMVKRIEDSRSYISDLEFSIKNNKPFDLESLLERYSFPLVMTKFHNKNIKLLKEELNSKSD